MENLFYELYIQDLLYSTNSQLLPKNYCYLTTKITAQCSFGILYLFENLYLPIPTVPKEKRNSS